MEAQEVDPCPVCGSNNAEWVQSDTQRGYWCCLDCGHVYSASDEPARN